MRRFTLSVLLALFTIAGIAAELNIYASGLRLHGASPVTGENQVHIDYFLNAPATDLKFVVRDATTGDEKTSVTIPAGTSNANYTKGLHEDVVVDLSSFFGAGDTYKWAIRATNSTANTLLTKISDSSAKFILYAPKGVTVNAYPETDAFGTIYVSMPADGQSDGGSATSKAQKQGIFVWDPALNLVNTGNAGFKGDLTWQTDNAYGAYRLKVAANGDLYMGASHASVHNLYKISADFSHFEPLLGHAPRVSGIEIVGNTIYTLEGIGYNSNTGCLGNMIQYNLDELPASGVGTTYATAKTTKTGNAQTSLDADGNGGFWICQYRETDQSGMPVIAHLSTSKTIDWNSYTAGIGLSLSTRGAMGVSPDKSLLAVCTGAKGAKKLYLYSIAWSGTTPALTKISEASVGNNVDGVAFDYANNLYSVNSSTELLYVWATPKSTNSCTTPAASSRTIVLESYIPEVHVTGVTLDETSKTVTVGESFTLTATVAPNDASDKSISWSTSNSNVATVADGVVTTKAVGTATITVTTTDGNKTATCDVTVDPKAPLAGTYNIGGDAPDFASLYEAFQYAEDWGISADVTFLICADLNENHNVGITNNTAYTIAVRPNAAVKRTIQYGSQADNAGPSGHIVIGATNAIDFNTTIPTRNILIDGSYNDEGQYLEFRGGTKGGVVVVFYGNVTNSVVRNCRLISPRTDKTTYVVHFRTEKNSDNAPVGVGFENCYMEVLNAQEAQAVYYNGSQSLTATGKPTNCYVRGCEIASKLRCIFFNGANGAIFEGNTFRLKAASPGYLVHGIMGNAQSGTIIVSGNKFIEMTTTNTAAAKGLQAITASGGAEVWKIENNYFAGMNATAASDKDFALTYVRCGDSCVVRQNTFYMPSLSNKPATAILSATPIACLYLAGTKNYPVENNIFVSAETEANNSLIRGALNANVKNNVFYHAGGNAYIVAGAASKQDWAAFTQGGANAGSVWNNPAFVNAAEGDLRLTISDETLKMARLDEVLTDIEGTSRPDPTFAGAHELIPVDVTSVTINATDMVLAPGAVKTLTAEVLPDNTTYTNLTWASDNAAVTINPTTGQLTAVSAGTAHITATIGGVTSDAITVEVSNPVPHIYAYNLNRELSTVDYSTYTFSFETNVDAVEGNLVFYKESDGSLVDKVAITGSITTAAPIEVVLTKAQLPECDEPMTWAVELKGADSKVVGKFSDDSDKFKFYNIRGISANVYPETDGFGNIYVNMALNGDTDGASERTKTQTKGIFQFDAALNLKNPTNAGYTGGIAWPGTISTAPFRTAVGEDGLLYVSGDDASYAGVWVLDNPDASVGTFQSIISGNQEQGLCVTGTGSQKKLYTFEKTSAATNIMEYPIGSYVPYLGTGNIVSSCAAAKMVYSNLSYMNMASDGQGGLWLYEYRYEQNASYVCLSHLNAAGTLDFDSYSTNIGIDNSVRGGFAVNANKTLMACATASKVTIFSIDMSGAAPSLTTLYEIPINGEMIDAVAFDYADNIYVGTSDAEYMYAYALPIATNQKEVPAKKALTVTKTVNVPVTGVALNKTATNLLVGASETLIATLSPTEPAASDQVVTWSSSNETVAVVSASGEVTAQHDGTATITVTTHDGGYTATCEVTVTKVAVTSVNLNYTALDMPLGGKTTLAATVVPDNASFPTVTWTSGNEAIATVSAAGVVTAVAAGSVTITATADGVSGTCEITVHAPVAHIYAYDLNSEIVGDNYELSFKSNIPYVSGNIILYNGGVQYGEKLPITSNPMIIPRASLPSMDLTWAVELTAESNMFVGELTNASAGIYNFYLPQGVAVDNSPESSWFGHIYITQPVNGASDGMTTRTKNQQGGLFVYDPQLNELNPTNQGYSMGVAPVTGRNDFKRVNVDAQGNVYVNSTNAIYKASPENMTTSTAIGSGLFTTINSFALTGADDNLQFCIMDNASTTNGGTMKTMVAPFAETNTLLQSAKFGNADNAIVSDGFGGWWVVQNRYSADAYNVLSHVTAGGVIDYAINNTSNSTLAPSEPVSYRGVLALNRVGTLLAIGGGNTVALYDVNYNGTDAPVLTKSSITLPTLGQNIDGVAFDYAGNLYVVSAKTERFYAFSLPTDNNTCEVPAKSTLVLNQYNTINLDETATNSTLINSNNGVTVSVTFNRRFTVADGWYTLVLPFDLTAAQMAEVFGADYRLCELETSYLKSETMMYLRFRDVDDLEAGKPYLFKTGVDITDDIVFNAVTINNATPQVVTDKVTMIGLYDQTVVGASDLNYYLGYEDYLYEYLTDKTTKAFRCYFHFASPSLIQGRNARVIFRDDVTTDLEDETFETAPAVQKIIRNGQLIIIRDGVEYNAQGQVVK